MEQQTCNYGLAAQIVIQKSILRRTSQPCNTFAVPPLFTVTTFITHMVNQPYCNRTKSGPAVPMAASNACSPTIRFCCCDVSLRSWSSQLSTSGNKQISLVLHGASTACQSVSHVRYCSTTACWHHTASVAWKRFSIACWMLLVQEHPNLHTHLNLTS